MEPVYSILFFIFRTFPLLRYYFNKYKDALIRAHKVKAQRRFWSHAY